MATAISRRKRLREVEAHYLDGLGPKEIHDRIGERFSVTAGTIKNDVVAVRKTWRMIPETDPVTGRARYLASCYNLRRLAMASYEYVDASGHGRCRPGALRFVHQMDREIAKLAGVDLNEQVNVEFTMNEARQYARQIMGIVLKYVPQDDQELLIREIEQLDDGAEADAFEE